MSDNRYSGGRSGGRRDSIFSDDDRQPPRGSEGRGEDRGFLQRAGEEVMSWFSGDEDGRERRDGPRERGDYGAYQQGREGHRDYAGSYGNSYGGSSGGSEGRGSYGGRQSGGRDYGREFSHQPSYHGQSQFEGGRNDRGGETQSRGGGSHLDDHYRSWRDRQIQQLDSEYEDYCRHRQEQFEKDFHGWRERQSGDRMSGGRPPNRETISRGPEAGMTGQAGIASGRTGSEGQSQGSGTTTGDGSRNRGSEGGDRSSGEAMASGGATASGEGRLGDEASTGSSASTRSRTKSRQ